MNRYNTLIQEYLDESKRCDDSFDDKHHYSGDYRYKQVTLELLYGILSALNRISFFLAALFGFLVATKLF